MRNTLAFRRTRAAEHVQAAMRSLTLAVGHDDPDLQPIAERLIEGTIGDKPHLIAVGRSQLEQKRQKGPLPSSMRTLLRMLDIPEPNPVV